MVLAEGDAGLGFSKDEGPEPCESLKRGGCHDWAEGPDVFAPAWGAAQSTWLVPVHVSSLQEEAPASKAEQDVNAASQRNVLPC